MWYTTKELAEHLGVSARTIRRKAQKDEYKTKYVTGASGKELRIFYDRPADTSGHNIPEKEKSSGQPADTPEDRPADTSKIPQTTANKGDNKEHPEPADNHCKLSDFQQLTDNKEVTESLQCTVNSTVNLRTPADTDVSAYKYEDLQESIHWIDSDSTVNLLGITRQSLHKKLQKKEYFSHKVKKPSGGFVTFIRCADLPIEIQEEWKKLQYQNNNFLELPNVSNKAKFDSYPQQHKDIAFAWEACILEYEQWVHKGRKEKLSITKIVDKRFIEACKKGDILETQWGILGGFSIQTLRRHIKEYEEAGRDLLALVPRYKGKVGRNPLYNNEKVKEIYQFIRVAVADPRCFNYKDIYRMAEDRFGKPLPFSYRTMCSYIKKHVASDTMLMSVASGKTAYKNRAKLHITRMNDAYPGDIWQGDGHQLNFLVKSPFVRLAESSLRQLVRPLMYAWIDSATEMITGFAVSYGEGFDVMVSSFRDGVEKCGIPQGVMIDNGSANKNVMTAPHEFAERKSDTPQRRTARQLVERGYPGFFQTNGVNRVIFVTPGNPEAKKIESAFGYIFGAYEKEQFTYLGESPENRPEYMNLTNMALMKKYGDKIMSWNELIETLSAHIEKYNSRKKKHLNERSPAEVYEQCGPFIIPSKVKLDHSMVAIEVTTVTRDGVKIMGIPFEHPLFINHIGEKVEVRYDTRNLKTVKIASLNGEVWAGEAEATVLGSYTDRDMSVEAIRARARAEKDRKRAYNKSMKKNGITKPDVFQEAEIMQEMEMEDFLRQQMVDQKKIKVREIEDATIETVLEDFVPVQRNKKDNKDIDFEDLERRAFGG